MAIDKEDRRREFTIYDTRYPLRGGHQEGFFPGKENAVSSLLSVNSGYGRKTVSGKWRY